MKSLFSNKLALFRTYPLEVLLAVVMAGSVFAGQMWFQTGIPLLLPICWIAFFVLNGHRWLYPLPIVYLCACGYLAYMGWADVNAYLDSSVFWGFAYLHVIWLFARDFNNDNRTFVAVCFGTFAHLLESSVVAGIAVVLVIGLCAGVDFLFVTDWLSDPIVQKIVKSLAILLFHLYFLNTQYAKKEQIVVAGIVLDKHASTLLNWVLSPALILYTLVLYAYVARVMVSFQLPRESLAIVVLPYLALGLFCVALRYLLQEPSAWRNFYRYFHWLALAPLVLLWLGIAERVSTYGLTEMRLYLILTALLASVLVVLSLSRKTLKYNVFSVLGMATVLVPTVFINPAQLVMDNQIPRLQVMLRQFDLLDKENHLKAEIVQNNSVQVPQDKEKALTDITELANYLHKMLRQGGKNAVYSPETLRQLGELRVNFPQDMAVAQKQALGGLARFMFYQDGDLGINISHYSRYQPIALEISPANSNPEEQDFNPVVAVNINGKQVTFSQEYFQKLFAQAGLPKNQVFQASQLEQAKQVLNARVLAVPTENGGLLVLKELEFVYAKYRNFTGYVLEQAKVEAYFHPLAEKAKGKN